MANEWQSQDLNLHLAEPSTFHCVSLCIWKCAQDFQPRTDEIQNKRLLSLDCAVMLFLGWERFLDHIPSLQVTPNTEGFGSWLAPGLESTHIRLQFKGQQPRNLSRCFPGEETLRELRKYTGNVKWGFLMTSLRVSLSTPPSLGVVSYLIARKCGFIIWT